MIHSQKVHHRKFASLSIVTTIRILIASSIMMIATERVQADVLYDSTGGLGASAISLSGMTATFLNLSDPGMHSSAKFPLNSSSSIVDSVKFWGSGSTYGGNQTTFDDFNGTISWAIYSDQAGKPGSILSQGSDTDITPVQDLSGASPTFSMDVDTGGISLATGDYWLVVSEGALGSAHDGSRISWRTLASNIGSTSTERSFDDGASWSSWSSDLAFQVLGTTIPEPATLSLLTLGTLMLLRRRR